MLTDCYRPMTYKKTPLLPMNSTSWNKPHGAKKHASSSAQVDTGQVLHRIQLEKSSFLLKGSEIPVNLQMYYTT